MTAFVHEGRRSFVVLFAVLAMIAALLAIPATPANAVATDACPATIPSAGFTDLAGFSVDVVDAANCLAFYGITKGTSATTYGPAANVSRWQMALFLTRQAVDHGVTLPSGADQGFTDLTGLSAEAVTAINQLAQLNITKGTSATTFDPNGNVGRWQMALFITRLVTGAGITLPSGADQGFTDISTLAAETQTAINQTAQLAISKGTTATTFDPTGLVTRAQMSLFLTRTLEAGGVTPPVVAGPSDAPELTSVTFDDDDADQTRLIYKFDEDVSLVGGVTDFVLVDVTGTLWDADEVDKWSDDEIEVIFDNDYIDVAAVAAVTRGAVQNIDGDDNPAGSVGWAAYTLDGVDLPGNDTPDLVAVGAFDNDDDTLELEFDVDITAVTENLIYFVEEDGTVWPGDPLGLNNDVDDEIVTVELLGNPGTTDVGNVVRVFLAPAAVASADGANAPHSLDIKLSGETDEAPSLSGVTIDRTDKEVTFTFNRSVVDEAYVPGDFVLVSIDPAGAPVLVFPGAAADLDRDTATTIVWDTDDGGAAELAMGRMIVYAGVWDSGVVGGTLNDFATGEELEVGHFVNFSTPFPKGATSAPMLITSAGSAGGLAGDEYEIVLEYNVILDEGLAGVVEADLWLFETNGDNLDPVSTVDVSDEEVTLTVADGATGFDELDDGDVAIFSFDAGFATSPGGYESYPTSIGCGC